MDGPKNELRGFEHKFERWHSNAETAVSAQKSVNKELEHIETKMRILSNAFGDMDILRENFGGGTSPSISPTNGIDGDGFRAGARAGAGAGAGGGGSGVWGGGPGMLKPINPPQRVSRLNSLSPNAAKSLSKSSSIVSLKPKNRYPLRKSSVSALLKLSVLPTPKLKDRRKSSFTHDVSEQLWHDRKPAERATIKRRELVYFTEKQPLPGIAEKSAAKVFFNADNGGDEDNNKNYLDASKSLLSVPFPTVPSPTVLLESSSSPQLQPMFEHGNNLSPLSALEKRKNKSKVDKEQILRLKQSRIKRSHASSPTSTIGDDFMVKTGNNSPNTSPSKHNFAFASKNFLGDLQKTDLDEKPTTPNKLYMMTCRKLNTNPEPVISKLLNGVNLDGGVVLRNMGLGDKQTSALAEAIGATFLKYIDLTNNRMSNPSACKILSKMDSSILQKLDLSKNRLGSRAYKMLNSLVAEATNLKVLGLEEANMRVKDLQGLCKSLMTLEKCNITDVIIHQCPVEKVNVAGNKIGDEGAEYIAELLRAKTNLTELDLSWNNIKKGGAISIFNAVEKSKLSSLDMGYNALGTSTDIERSATVAVAKMFRATTELNHLNIAHNQLNADDCKILSEALQNNHSLMGLHVEGNYGFVDSKGFLIPTAKRSEDDIGSTVFSRILNSAMPEIKNKEHWTATNNCWICERWQEYTFAFNGKDSTGLMKVPYNVDLINTVEVATNFNKWVPNVMTLTGEHTGVWELVTMVPPGNNQYCFVINGDVVCAASDQEVTKRAETWGKIDEKNSLRNLPAFVNRVVIEIPPEFDADGSLLPRCKGKKAPRAKQEWSLPISCFAEFIMDDTTTIEAAFLQDISMTRIEKTICKKARKEKDVEQFEFIKEILLDNFSVIKNVFRNYAAAVGSGNEIFCMGKNSYYEFLNQCGLIAEDKHVAVEKERKRRGSKEIRATKENRATKETRPSSKEEAGAGAGAGAGVEEAKGEGDGVEEAKGEGDGVEEGEGEQATKTLVDREPGVGIGRAEVGLMFVACQSVGPKASFNKKNSLNRFQFLEVVVLLALERYPNLTPSESVITFIDDVLRPESDLEEELGFRDSIIHTEKVDILFKRNMGVVDGLFEKYSGKTNLPGEKKTCSYLEWSTFFGDSKLIDEGFVERNVRLAYVKSLPTPTRELHEPECRTMDKVEFIHGLCWTAACLTKEKGATYCGSVDDLCANLVRLLAQCKKCLN